MGSAFCKFSFTASFVSVLLQSQLEESMLIMTKYNLVIY